MRRIVWMAALCWCASVGTMAQKTLQQEADSVVKYQLKSGGWPKNQRWLEGVDPKEAQQWRRTGIGSTIDNGATVGEMETLAKAVDQIVVMLAENYKWLDKDLVKERRARYTAAFRRGVDYLLKMQLSSGGFPQFYPEKRKGDYSSQITFNDDAMVNALRLLRDVAGDSARFQNMAVPEGVKKKCQAAYERGVQCVVNCQIRVDETGRVLEFGSPSWGLGTPTVWCQQHDRLTFLPVGARAYELPSYTGHGETCAILDLLMDVKNPSTDVKEAVRSGVAWLEAHAMKDVVVEQFTNGDGKPDIRLKPQAGAPLLWARFYDLPTAEPMFCDRDGVPRKSLSDIGYERRNGYQWVGDAPQKVIERYREWSTTH